MSSVPHSIQKDTIIRERDRDRVTITKDQRKSYGCSDLGFIQFLTDVEVILNRKRYGWIRF